MTRYKAKYSDDPSLPPTITAYTPEEEAAADALAAQPAVPTIDDRLSALETVLVQKSIVTQTDLDTAVEVALPPTLNVVT